MTAPGRSFTAGAGKAAVELPFSLLPVDGFSSVHDPLQVRVLVLDDGEAPLAIAVIDQTSIFDDQLARTRKILRQTCGVPPDRCLIVASHTFSAPHVLPPDRVPESERKKNELLAAAVDTAVARAAHEAARTRGPARTGFGRGICRVGVQRDVPTPHGWWLGADDAGPTDDSVGVLRIDRPDGRPVAILVNHAVQPSVMNGSVTRSGERRITADLAGATAERIERRYGDGTVALFLIGAAGDQAPYLTAVRTTVTDDGALLRTDVHDDGFALVELLGERLADEAVRVAERICTTAAVPPLRVLHDRVKVPAQVPPAGLHALHPTKEYDFTPAGDTEAPIVVARVGDAVLACVQAELNAGTGLDIRAASPFPATCVVTMTNGAAKYLADAMSYDRITYEAMNSRYARGAAERVAERISELLRSLRPGASHADG